MSKVQEYKIDLHNHSLYSGDNKTDPEETIVAAIDAGLHGIAFTEHHSYSASAPIETLKKKYAAHITVFRGVEYSSQHGHILVFGVHHDRFFKEHYMSMQRMINLAHNQGGIAIPSHPFRPTLKCLDEKTIRRLRGLVAIEACNGHNFDRHNEEAKDLGKKLRLKFIGGSDSHSPEDVGACYTVFRGRVTPETLVQTLKKGYYTAVQERTMSDKYAAIWADRQSSFWDDFSKDDRYGKDDFNYLRNENYDRDDFDWNTGKFSRQSDGYGGSYTVDEKGVVHYVHSRK
jgi:predicted metal-dependent phosphoesterase TrpH